MCCSRASGDPIHLTALYRKLNIAGTRVAAYELDLCPEDVLEQVRIDIRKVPFLRLQLRTSILHILPALHSTLHTHTSFDFADATHVLTSSVMLPTHSNRVPSNFLSLMSGANGTVLPNRPITVPSRGAILRIFFRWPVTLPAPGSVRNPQRLASLGYVVRCDGREASHKDRILRRR